MKTNTFNNVVICLFSALMLVQLTSCKIFDPDTSVPVYIRVPAVVFKDNTPNVPAAFGDTTSDITDLWTYADNNPTGVYDVPSLYPVLVSGSTLFQLTPGVYENGISNTRAVYPFYTYDTTTFTVQPPNTYSITPHYTYRSGVALPLNCNFEQGVEIQPYPPTSTNIAQLCKSPYVKYGKCCGYMHVNSDSQVCQALSISSYALTNSGGVWLEMDYMCNITFSVGLIGIIGPGDTALVGNSNSPYVDYFEGLNPIGTWTKVYINLTNTIQAINANSYQLAFYAQWVPGNPNEGNIYIDNIKLVYIPQ